MGIRYSFRSTRYFDFYQYSRHLRRCQVPAGGWRDQIFTQKWIAIFPLGNEAWAEYRRTGYPKLLPAPQNLGPDDVDLDRHARRLTYPVDEYSGNGTNLNEAISALNAESSDGNGDSFNTRVWWDRKPYNSIK